MHYVKKDWFDPEVERIQRAERKHIQQVTQLSVTVSMTSHKSHLTHGFPIWSFPTTSSTQQHVS